MSHYAVTVSIGAQPAWTRAGQREPCDVISQQCLWNHALDYNSGNTCVLWYYTIANFQTFTRHIFIFLYCWCVYTNNQSAHPHAYMCCWLFCCRWCGIWRVSQSYVCRGQNRYRAIVQLALDWHWEGMCWLPGSQGLLWSAGMFMYKSSPKQYTSHM